MLALVALLATALLGLIGLVVDAGVFYAERRQVQNGADEAAAAAAHEISYGGGVSAATTAALQNAAANGFNNNGTSNTVTVRIPPTSGEHVGDPTYVEVVLTEEPTTFFIHTVLSAGHVQGRGVAGLVALPKYALFATDPNCNNSEALHLEGSGDNNVPVVEGSIHSNSGLLITGSNVFVDGQASYVCQAAITGSSSSVDIGPVQVASPLPAPVSHTFADFPCDFYSTGNLRINTGFPQYFINNDPDTLTLKPGVYCAEGDLEVDPSGTGSASNLSGNVTFVAQGKVRLMGSNYNFTAFWNNVLLFAESNDNSEAILMHGSGGIFQGIVLASQGGVLIHGSSTTSPAGLVVGEEILVEGSNVNITAMDFAGPVEVALVE